MKIEDSFDLKNLLLSKEKAQEIAKAFRKKAIPFVKKNVNTMLTFKGGPGTLAISTTHGFYVGRQFALYLSKNPQKKALESIDLKNFYSDTEKTLLKKVGDKIDWRTNLLVNIDTKEIVEIEFIPMAFRGDFLLGIIKNLRDAAPLDWDIIYHEAVMAIGKLFHEVLSEKGYKSSYPRAINLDDNNLCKLLQKEIEEADFHVELRYVEKSIFSIIENELIEKYSESPLEKNLGLELLREGIPILIQHKIKADFPTQRSKRIISTPDFMILRPFNPIAVFCDSYKYHQRKKDQILRDKRIDRQLQKMSFVVLRFDEEEINRNLKGCIEEIKEHYLGKQYALSTQDIMLQKLKQIDISKLSEWGMKFVRILEEKLKQAKDVSLKEERILNTILKKQQKTNDEI